MSSHGKYQVHAERAWDREPFRIGMIQDWGCGVPPILDQYDAQQLAFDEAFESGLLDRPVEQIIVEMHGPPFATCDTVLDEYRRVVRETGVVAMIGPRLTDDAVALARIGLAEELGVVTLSDCGNRHFPSDYGFCLPNGTFMDESTIMLGYLKNQGAARVGIFREDNPIAAEYMEFLRPAARRLDLDIVCEWISPTTFDRTDAERALEYIRSTSADSLLYTGFGSSGSHFFSAVRDSGWQSPRVLNSIFMGSIPDLGYDFKLEHFEGWGGIDQFDERNEHFVAFLDRFEARFGRRPIHCYSCLGYDFGRVLSEGLSMAKPLSRSGLRDSMELVRMLPAATGSPGTYISFGRYDHRGFKGPYIVVREVRDGKNVLAASQGFEF